MGRDLMAGRCMQLRFVHGFKDSDVSLVVDVFHHEPDGVPSRYWKKQQFWGVGMYGFGLREVNRRIGQFVETLKVYGAWDWTPRQNVVLKSRWLHRGEPRQSSTASV